MNFSLDQDENDTKDILLDAKAGLYANLATFTNHSAVLHFTTVEEDPQGRCYETEVPVPEHFEVFQQRFENNVCFNPATPCMPMSDRFYLEYKLDVKYTFTYKGKDVFMLFPKVEWTAIDLTGELMRTT